VWHPGGAHPFVGLNEALVHNGDFANYASITEYLAQKNIHPHFLTDTEVAVLVFDYLHRTLKYPLEYVIECLAPTTEMDFSLLPSEKHRIYKALQRTHMHGSPDGPWFFLIAQSKTKPTPTYRLIGITDTSMLRPQVFALQEGEVSIGFAASEKQAIDAALASLSTEDPRFWKFADRYWNARGGSYTDGGAFLFTVLPQKDCQATFICSDKFGKAKKIPKKNQESSIDRDPIQSGSFPDLPSEELFNWAKNEMKSWNYRKLQEFLAALALGSERDHGRQRALEVITALIDQHFPTTSMRRSKMLSLFHDTLSTIVESIRNNPTPKYAYLNNDKYNPLPHDEHQTLIIDAENFAREGKNSLALSIVRMFKQGFRKFLIANCRGHRFIANGIGQNSSGARIDVFGSSGDYLASGIDGAEIYVHGNAQDQIGQIMKQGKLVIYGDVGQTLLYAAKGGKIFILGNAAGRPLINAVGVPRVIINGTCLDYLAESFMAGNPLEKGGFVVINAIKFDEDGNIIELESPYPGTNLFSLPSGGAIYIRDPDKSVTAQQLNGAEIVGFAQEDWDLIIPYLEENEALFNIPINRLLSHNGKTLSPHQIYRKIRPKALRILEPEEAWVTKHKTAVNR
jgi:glutamate synthase domain-containing protein 3